jgi:hypothetical protein
MNSAARRLLWKQAIWLRKLTLPQRAGRRIIPALTVSSGVQATTITRKQTTHELQSSERTDRSASVDHLRADLCRDHDQLPRPQRPRSAEAVLSASGRLRADKADQELNYSTVVICFQFAYAVRHVGAGKFIDKVGTKSGYAWSLIGWSIAAIGHAFGHHTWSFGCGARRSA